MPDPSTHHSATDASTTTISHVELSSSNGNDTKSNHNLSNNNNSTSPNTVKSSSIPSRQELILLLSKLQKKLQTSELSRNEYKQKYELLSIDRNATQHNIADNLLNIVVSVESDVSEPHISSSDSVSNELKLQIERSSELEQQCSIAQQRLKQTFELLKQSKHRVNELQQQLLTLQSSHEQQIGQIKHTHQQQIDELTKQHERSINTLKSQHNVKCQSLQSTHSQQIDELRHDLSELNDQLLGIESERQQHINSKKTLNQRSVQISELIDSLDKERAARDSDKIQHDHEIDLLTHECERIRLDSQQQLLQIQNDQRDSIATVQQQYTDSIQQIKQLESDMRAQQDELKSEQVRVAQQQDTINKLQSQIDSLNRTISESQQQRDREVRTIEFKHIEKYERAQRESQQNINKLNNELNDRNALINELQTRCSDLQQEIDTGRPAERKLYELANLQARRDESLHHIQAENRELKQQLDELQTKLSRYKTERQFLTQQLQQHTRSQSLSQINIDYLRSIIVRYMQFQNQAEQRDQLTTVIARLLQFTRDDMQNINKANTQSNSSSFLSAMFRSSNNNTPIKSNNDMYRYSQSNPNLAPDNLVEPHSNPLNQLYSPSNISNGVELHDKPLE